MRVSAAVSRPLGSERSRGLYGLLQSGLIVAPGRTTGPPRPQSVGDQLIFRAHRWQIFVHQFKAPRLLLPPLLSKPANRLTVALIHRGPHVDKRPVCLPIRDLARRTKLAFDGLQLPAHENR